MAEEIVEAGKNMPVIGQASRMECWITCYQMMLKAKGIHWTPDQIEKRMASRGFGDAKNCRNTGISDAELSKCADALGVGQNSTSSINSLRGLKIMLQLCGPLFVAGQFPGIDGNMYNHVIMVRGVDEGARRVQIVNPWVNNKYDSPSQGWCPWVEFKQSIKSTLNVPGSVQYLTPLQAVTLALAP